MAKYISKETGQPWRGRRRTNAQLAAVGELGTWPTRKAMREMARAGHMLAIRAEEARASTARHFEWLDAWKPIRRNVRGRAGWAWKFQRCRSCGEYRYASLMWQSQVAFKCKGAWVIRSIWTPGNKDYKPNWKKPLGSLKCRCPGRRPPIS